ATAHLRSILIDEGTAMSSVNGSANTQAHGPDTKQPPFAGATSMNRLTNLAISAKLALAFAAVILVVVAVGIGTYVKLGFLEQTSGWTNHTYQVLETADAVMASMVDQETGVRGYLVSGDNKFLEPYRNGRANYE